MMPRPKISFSTKFLIYKSCHPELISGSMRLKLQASDGS